MEQPPMILDADCLGFDKESVYSDLGFGQGIFTGHILDLYCVRLSKAVRSCENCTNLYIDAKHLEKELNRGKFWGPFFIKNCPFGPISNVALNSRICPAVCSQCLLITNILTWSHRYLLSKGFKLRNNFINMKFNTTFHCQRYLLFQRR